MSHRGPHVRKHPFFGALFPARAAMLENHNFEQIGHYATALLEHCKEALQSTFQALFELAAMRADVAFD